MSKDKRTNCVMGIDPGLSGAVCVYDPKNREIVALWSIPVKTEFKKRKKIREVNTKQFKHLMTEAIDQYGVDTIVVEDVHASPQMGVSSAFKFGTVFGIIQALAEGSDASRIEYVSPARWKARMMVTSDKKQTIEKAINIFGKSPWFSGRVSDGCAEAALIAYFGARDFTESEEIEDEEDPLS